jgi:hypothetical protein
MLGEGVLADVPAARGTVPSPTPSFSAISQSENDSRLDSLNYAYASAPRRSPPHRRKQRAGRSAGV